MFRLIFFASSCLVLLHGRIIFPWNLTTTTTRKTSTPIVKMTTMELNGTTTTNFTPTTTMETSTVEYAEETSTLVNEKPFEFKSNFSRSNDSVFVSFYGNSSNSFVSINNTFDASKSYRRPCEIVFHESSIRASSNITTQITIHFNGSLTNDLALQLGDRLVDMADLLLTIGAFENSNRSMQTN